MFFSGVTPAASGVSYARDLELARRLDRTSIGRRVTETCLKIGVVKTNIWREFPRWMKLLVPLLFDPLLGQSREEAAASALKLALAPEFEGATGELFLKIRKFKRVGPSARSRRRRAALGTEPASRSDRADFTTVDSSAARPPALALVARLPTPPAAHHRS